MAEVLQPVAVQLGNSCCPIALKLSRDPRDFFRIEEGPWRICVPNKSREYDDAMARFFNTAGPCWQLIDQKLPHPIRETAAEKNKYG